MYRVLSCVLVLGAGALVVGPGVRTANADLLTMDSASFDYRYEMTAWPGGENKDTNPAADWDDVSSSPQWSGGGWNYDTPTNGGGSVGSTLSTGVWQANFSDSEGYTIEVRMKVLSLATEKADSISIWAGLGNGIGVCSMTPSQTAWAWGSNGSYQVLDTNSNSDAFHVFRIARLSNSDTYKLWRDGVLLDTFTAIESESNSLYVAAMGGNWGGTAAVDYIRLTPGAYAPLPEPTTLTLLITGALGLLAYAWRRRR